MQFLKHEQLSLGYSQIGGYQQRERMNVNVVRSQRSHCVGIRQSDGRGNTEDFFIKKTEHYPKNLPLFPARKHIINLLHDPVGEAPSYNFRETMPVDPENAS